MSTFSTIAKNILKWALICAGTALLIGMIISGVAGFAAALGTAGAPGAAAWAFAGKAGGFLVSGMGVAVGLGSALVGTLIGTGAGILEARRDCDGNMCEGSLATKAERLLGMEPSVNQCEGKGYGPDAKNKCYAEMYKNMGYTTRTDNAERLRPSTGTTMGVRV